VTGKAETTTKRLLGLTASLEAVTGLALMIEPAIVSRLLLGTGVSGVGLALGRVAGFALVSLGLACWPSPDAPGGVSAALRGMLAYNPLAAIYLLYLGIVAEETGVLLWPAMVIHAVLTLLLARAWFENRQGRQES